jgi:hypothetical protein
MQVRDLLPVEFRKVGVEPHWFDLKTRKFRGNRRLARFQCI